MSPNDFPEGWEESKVDRVLAHYDAPTDDEAVAEDEAGLAPSETVMSIPRELVAKVRKRIAKHHE